MHPAKTRKTKNHSSAVLILWIVALVIWISQYCVSNTIEELIKKIKIFFYFWWSFKGVATKEGPHPVAAKSRFHESLRKMFSSHIISGETSFISLHGDIQTKL